MKEGSRQESDPEKKTLDTFYREREREKKVLVWLQTEMSSVRAPEPEGTNLTVCMCVFACMDSALLHLFHF